LPAKVDSPFVFIDWWVMAGFSRRQFLKSIVASGVGLASQFAIGDLLAAGAATRRHLSPHGDPVRRIIIPEAPINLPDWNYGDSSSATETVLMFRGSPARNFYGTGPVGDRFDVRFKVEFGCFDTTLRGQQARWCGTGWTGQPAVLGGHVFVGGTDRCLYAIDARTGQIAWKTMFGRMIKSSVCIFRNRIYVGCVDDVFRCVDAATGQVVWSVHVGTDIDSSACIWRGRLYVAGESGFLRCLDPADGREIWRTLLGGVGPGSLPGSNGSETSPAVHAGLVYAATYDGVLFCVDADSGRVVWKAATGDDTDASPVISGDNVIVASESRSSGVFCFDRTTGSRKWCFRGYRGGYWATPAVRDGRVFVGGGAGGGIYCLDERDGSLIWHTRLAPWVWSSPCVVDGKVIFGAHDGLLRMLDAKDGRIVAEVDLGGRILSTPCIVNGTIFVGTGEGRFFRIDTVKQATI